MTKQESSEQEVEWRDKTAAKTLNIKHTISHTAFSEESKLLSLSRKPAVQQNETTSIHWPTISSKVKWILKHIHELSNTEATQDQDPHDGMVESTQSEEDAQQYSTNSHRTLSKNNPRCQ